MKSQPIVLTTEVILFDKPFKGKLFEAEDQVTITGVCKYFDSYLVFHSSGYTDIKFMPGKVVGQIRERLKAIKPVADEGPKEVDTVRVDNSEPNY